MDSTLVMVTNTERDSLNRPTTILLVEDDQRVRKWMHDELEKRGYNLLEACDGKDAMLIAELHHGPIDIVLTDIVMPNLNGPDLVKALLAMRVNAKVLYISGYSESYLRNSTTLPSEDNYLSKPFEISTLVNRITNLLDHDVK